MFIMTDGQYKQGVKLEEYQGKWSIISAQEGNDGKAYSQWCKAKRGDGEYASKDMPLGVRLGDQEQAIAVLETFLRLLKKEPSDKVDSDCPF